MPTTPNSCLMRLGARQRKAGKPCLSREANATQQRAINQQRTLYTRYRPASL